MPPQENQLPPFTGSEQPRPQPDMANIHITALRQHLTVTTVKNLLSSLTTSWLLTKKGQTCPDAVRLWRSAVEEHFNAERLQELHTDYGNLGRIALLHILEFSLFEVVKKAIVEKQEQGIENAVAELTEVSRALFRKLAPHLSEEVRLADNSRTTTALDTDSDRGVDCELFFHF
jgi:hypothetical protein